MTSYTPPRLPLPPTFNNIYFLETNFLTQGEAADTYLPKSSPIFSGSIRGPDGTAITPAYTFSSKPDTGIYLGSVHHINFTSLGVQRFHVADDHIRAYHPLRLSTDSPALTFQSDQNTGIANPSADVLNILTNGVERFRCSNSGVRVGVSGTDITQIQHGRYSGGATTGTIIFPTAFPNANVRVFGQVEWNGTLGVLTLHIHSITASSFQFSKVYTNGNGTTYGATEPFAWMAIGF